MMFDLWTYYMKKIEIWYMVVLQVISYHVQFILYIEYYIILYNYILCTYMLDYILHGIY